MVVKLPIPMQATWRQLSGRYEKRKDGDPESGRHTLVQRGNSQVHTSGIIENIPSQTLAQLGSPWHQSGTHKRGSSKTSRVRQAQWQQSGTSKRWFTEEIPSQTGTVAVVRHTQKGVHRGDSESCRHTLVHSGTGTHKRGSSKTSRVRQAWWQQSGTDIRGGSQRRFRHTLFLWQHSGTHRKHPESDTGTVRFTVAPVRHI